MSDERFDRGAGGLDDAVVGRLVRLADDDEPTPEALDRARLVLRPRWQLVVGRRRRLRRLAVVGAAAAVILVALTLALRPPWLTGTAVHPVATVARVLGDVEVRPTGGGPDQAQRLEAGTALAPGAWLETSPSSRIALALDGGTSVRLDAGTRVQLPAAGVLVLESGAVYGDRPPGGVTLEVRTGPATVRDIGTQFEVRKLDDGLSIKVREGLVGVSSATTSVEVAAGGQLVLNTDGSVSRTEVHPMAADWEWTRTVSPPFLIEGRSAVALLDWVSRETGLAISFEDAEVERFAGQALLHGPEVSMSPEAAPAALLPACGLDARREGDAFVVGWRDALSGDKRQEVHPPGS